MAVYSIQSDREAEAHVRSLYFRMFASLAVLVGIVMISTIGLVLFGRAEGEPFTRRVFMAFWDTLNFITTVGDIDESLTPGQRAWAMFVIIFGLGTVLTAFSTLQGILLGGSVRRHSKRKKMKRSLEHISDHIVLCGYGHVGREVARHIRNAGLKLVIIERNDDAVAAADEAGFFIIQADCTGDHTLVEAGIERASGLIVTLDTDASNVYLILIARELRPDLRIVTRGERGDSRRTLRRAGADRVIIPGESAGQQLSQLILKPRMSEFMSAAITKGDYDFAEIEVAEHASLQNKSLRELNLTNRARVIVISVLDGEGKQEFSPSADRVLTTEDTLLVVSSRESAEHLAGLD